jgi:hypothetical protein
VLLTLLIVVIGLVINVGQFEADVEKKISLKLHTSLDETELHDSNNTHSFISSKFITFYYLQNTFVFSMHSQTPMKRLLYRADRDVTPQTLPLLFGRFSSQGLSQISILRI